MRRKRGAAMILALLLVAAMTFLLGAVADVCLSGVRTQQRSETLCEIRHAFDGACDRISIDYSNSAINLPATREYTIGSVNVALTITDNSTALPHTIKVAASMKARGITYSDTRIIGARLPPSPFYYAVFETGTHTWNDGLDVSDGDAYFRANVAPGGSAVLDVDGDLESSGTVSTTNVVVGGNIWANAPTLDLPSTDDSTYWWNATWRCGDLAIGGYSFFTSEMIYVQGNVNIWGTYRGKGTIYCTGRATITGPMYYFDSESKIAIIAKEIEVKATPARGLFFGRDRFKARSGSRNVVGVIVTKDLQTDVKLYVTFDPSIWNEPSLGRTLRLPGHWP